MSEISTETSPGFESTAFAIGGRDREVPRLCRMTRWLIPANRAQKSRPPSFSNVVGLAQKSQVVAGLLRDSVLLCRALGWFCNGHPASVIVKNRRFTKTKISKSPVPSSFEPGGRRFESVRARHRFFE